MWSIKVNMLDTHWCNSI